MNQEEIHHTFDQNGRLLPVILWDPDNPGEQITYPNIELLDPEQNEQRFFRIRQERIRQRREFS